MRKLLIVFFTIVGCFLANISNGSKDCSSSNCFSKKTISPYIKDYETLQYGREELLRQHGRAKRSLDTEEAAQVTWKFRAYNDDFHVILKRDTNTFHANVEIVDANERPLTSLNASHIYYGHLADEPHTSYVHGSISSHDGVFEGSIRSHKRGLFFVEHAKRFEPLRVAATAAVHDNKDGDKDVDDNSASTVHSVIYKDEHIVLEPYSAKEGHLGACGITPEVSDWMSSIQNSATAASENGGSSRLDTDSKSNQKLDDNDDSSHTLDGNFYRYDTDFQPKSLFTKNHHLFSASANIFHKERRSKRSTRKDGQDEIRNTCSLSIQTDPFLWRHIRKGFADHADLNKKREIDEKTREEILSLIAQHVTAVNYIYRDTKFDGRFEHRNIKFEVQRIKIDDDASCALAKTIIGPTSPRYAPPRSGNLPHHGFFHHRKRLLMHTGGRGSGSGPGAGSSNVFSSPPSAAANAQETNSFCVENIDVSNFLNLHSLRNHEVFCLAYVFTYRDFTGGTLGLAWVASASGASGGICEKYKTYTETVGGLYQSTKRSLNTGIITFVNYNTRVPPKVSQLTLAHEIGHNFGSPHDFPSECRPGGLSGNYIMFASATSGDRPNNSKFSSCSIGNISNVLDAIESSRKSNCFTASAGAFCGNKIVEAGEECDCGYDRKECLDRCCYPRIFESDDVRLNETALGCKRRKGSQCSPSQGPCCSHSCELIPAYPRIICRKETDCSDASFCNGTSPECPHPKPKRNKTRCNNDTQLCIDGECSASICLEWNLVECFLASTPPSGLPSGVPVTYSVKYDKRKLCELACQNGTDVRTCRSTSEFAHLVGLPPGGISLRPGSPCDNFQGYCDIFLRCRAVDAEGPLVRLKNLLLNKETLDQITQWMTQYWWGVVMVSVSFIFCMGLFIKCCAVYTPSSNPKRPPARRLPDTISRPMSTFKRMKHYTSHERRSGSSVTVNVTSSSPTSATLDEIADVHSVPVPGRSRSSGSNMSSSAADVRRHRPRNEHRSPHKNHHGKLSQADFSRTHVPSSYIRACVRNLTTTTTTTTTTTPTSTTNTSNPTPNTNSHFASSAAGNNAASASNTAAASAIHWNTKV